MLEIKGKIVFDPPDMTNKHKSQSQWKKVVIVEIADDTDIYYGWFINKRFNLILNRPLRRTHITIVNDRASELDEKMYDYLKSTINGNEITFTFDPNEIRTNSKHWWIRIKESTDAQQIRTLLGLQPIPHLPYHLTIGYANEKNIDHSKYILETIKFHNL